MRFASSETHGFDVVIVGSGAGGMLAALRAHDLGLKPVVIERSDRYGGTSAVSGGAIWIPNNGSIARSDTDDKALRYLSSVTEGQVPRCKLETYVAMAPRMVDYLGGLGVEYYTDPMNSHPDYYPDADGAMPGGRTMYVRPIDGGKLGKDFARMRESYPEFKLMERITLDLAEGATIVARASGWRRTIMRNLWRYWSDLPFRRRTHRDRRLSIGNALVGGLRAAMLARGIPLLLNARMTSLCETGGRITGVRVVMDGAEKLLAAGRAVILASGGFEQSQPMRNAYFPQPTDARWSAAPRDNNVGDALQAALAVGAATEFLGEAWWVPTIAVPSRHSPNIVRGQGIFFERAYPHSLAVNRLGRRFTNEACSYHQFGKAMIADQHATGANISCWFIFDAQYRAKYPLGGLQPGWAMPDAKVPEDWWDNLLYRADSIGALAAKIGVAADALNETVVSFNEHAVRGSDPEFGRGSNIYNQYFGDPAQMPSRNLGPVDKAPFYAVRLDLGDLGSKGGPKTDEFARVIGKDGAVIDGLYAVGNCAGSVMGPAYPGAGATLGAAMTFAYVAAGHVADAKRVHALPT